MRLVSVINDHESVSRLIVLAATHSSVGIHLGLAAERLLWNHVYVVHGASAGAGGPGRLDVGCSASLFGEGMSVLVHGADRGLWEQYGSVPLGETNGWFRLSS